MTQTVAGLVSVGELGLFLMCILLVTQTGNLVSEGELAWFSMCSCLVMQTVANLVSVGELAWFSMCNILVTLWPVLFQDVSWPGFQFAIFW